MVAIPLVKCNTNAVVILLTSAMALFGLCGGGDVSVIVDMAPDFAGKKTASLEISNKTN